MDGQRFVVVFDGKKCLDCGEGAFEGTDMEEFERRAMEWLAKGARSKEPIRISLASAPGATAE
jgi:hypothetical protein